MLAKGVLRLSVKPQVVAALTLNQLEPHYATFADGRHFQIKKIEKNINEIRQLITRMIRKQADIYNPETDELLDTAVNVTEYIIKSDVEYVIENYHKQQKDTIKSAQIEAMVLNKLPHHYAATVRGRNRLLSVRQLATLLIVCAVAIPLPNLLELQ